ncbi:MAG: hypothetical protein ACI9YB_002610, partial [Halioglobus sp.]
SVENPVAEQAEVSVENPVAEQAEVSVENPVAEQAEVSVENPVAEQAEVSVENPVAEQAEVSVENPVVEQAEVSGDSVKQVPAIPSVEEFKKTLETVADPEEKLSMSIELMRKTLSQSGSPHFRNFWEFRKICLPLFKNNINPAKRIKLWADYSELSKEARQLKEILDEQSAFAVEQIDIAIQTLEDNVENIKERLTTVSDVAFPAESQTLEPKFTFYNDIQRELSLLNTYAARINALRKELIKTEMRIRHKNKFFQRLSATGDKVFPKRKEHIKTISQQFIDDVEGFVTDNFTDTQQLGSLFYFREEIKALQGIAKILTLNTHSFTHTRSKLSESWDKVKRLEKDRKKERAQMRAVYKENIALVDVRIETYTKEIEEKKLSNADRKKSLNEISNFMKDLDLGRDEVRILKDKIAQLRQVIFDQEKSVEKERLDKENDRKRLKVEQFESLEERIETFLKEAIELENELITETKAALLLEIEEAPLLLKGDKQNLERLFRPLRDIIAEKKEKALMDMPEGDRQALESLRVMLSQRLERRQEIKTLLESYRKTSGTSSLDFEKAIAYKELIREEKEQLVKVNERIKELQEKIKEIESRV